MNGSFERITGRLARAFNRDRKKALLLLALPMFVVFCVVLYNVSAVIPPTETPQPLPSEFDLKKFISSYRSYQQDFDVDDLRFGKKFLHFTLSIEKQPKSDIFVKRLAMELAQGLTIEYPSLEDIAIEVKRTTQEGTVFVYGKAVYSRDDDAISWHYR